MKTLSLLVLIPFLTTAVYADTLVDLSPAGTPTESSTLTTSSAPNTPSLMTFHPLDPNPYPNRLAKRAEIIDPNGVYKVYVDQMTYANNSINQTTYHYKIMEKNDVLVDQDLYDQDITDLLSDSHLIKAKVSFAENRSEDSTNAPQTIQLEAPVVLLVFKTKSKSHPFKIIGVTGVSTRSQALSASATRYEFVKKDNDPNEEVVTYDRFNIPTTWALNGRGSMTHKKHGIVTDQNDERNYYVSYQQIPPAASDYDNLQKDLEAKLTDPSLDKLTLYLTHMELAKLYTSKSTQNPSPLDAFAQMASEQASAAQDLQPQFPLKDISRSSPIHLPPFSFYAEVDEMGKVNGVYSFKLFHVTASGQVELKSKEIHNQAEVAVQLRKLNNNNNYSRSFLNGGYQNASVSPTGLFRVTLQQDRDQNMNDINDIDLEVTSVSHGDQTEIQVPDTGGAQPLGWNTNKDLFYFLVSGYETRGSDLWQLDPALSQLKKIGCTQQSVYLSPDGEWILWGNAGINNNGDNCTSGFNAFNVEKGVSYRLTHSLEPKYFADWETISDK